METGETYVSDSFMPSRWMTAMERAFSAATIATTCRMPTARARSSVVSAASVAYPRPQCARPSRQPISTSPLGPHSCGQGWAPVKPTGSPAASSRL